MNSGCAASIAIQHNGRLGQGSRQCLAHAQFDVASIQIPDRAEQRIGVRSEPHNAAGFHATHGDIAGVTCGGPQFQEFKAPDTVAATQPKVKHGGGMDAGVFHSPERSMHLFSRKRCSYLAHSQPERCVSFKHTESPLHRALPATHQQRSRSEHVTG